MIDTALTTSGTRSTEVRFGVIYLAEGRTLNASGAATSSYGFDTLDVAGHAGAARIEGNFSLENRNLNFHPIPTIAEGMTLLTINGAATLTNARVGTPSLIGLQGGRSHRDVLTLLTATNLNGTPANEGAVFRGIQGISTGYDYVLRTHTGATGDMSLRMTAARATPQAKALSEGILGGLLFINQGVDLAANEAMTLAVESAEHHAGVNVFATFAGGRQRYDSGSHIDVAGANMLLGLSGGIRLAAGRFIVGAFAEYGDGTYDTRNSFGASGQGWSLNRAGRVKGEGSTDYMGGGLLIRHETDGGFHTEATARAGWVKTGFKSHDLVDYLGQYASYDARMRYVGAHVGVGQAWKISTGDALDIYGKYFWIRQQGDRVTLSTGDDIKFKAVNSERLRLGLRLSRKVSLSWSGYAGLAWEHEFNGKANATANTVAASYAIDAPKVAGGTGIVEVGFAARQSQSFPVSVDIGLQGHGGQRRGITGSLRVNRAF